MQALWSGGQVYVPLAMSPSFSMGQSFAIWPATEQVSGGADAIQVTGGEQFT
jgi:hypothetical protein